MTFQVRHGDNPIPGEFNTAGQAIRAMARTVHALPLTPAERRAFDLWYTYRNYRAVAERIYRGETYEMRISVGSRRQLFVIRPSLVPVAAQSA
ncbi:hypothetical protein [Streptomyces smyrnaeus]|uniref:hypothetical protein n=1 Tax=Streptomyces smyrnaeus TaxID=1387713 RepID=UPI003674DFE8